MNPQAVAREALARDLAYLRETANDLIDSGSVSYYSPLGFETRARGEALRRCADLIDSHPDAPASGEERVEAVAKAMQQSEQGAAGWTWEECSSIEVEGWKELARAALTAAGLPALVADRDRWEKMARDLMQKGCDDGNEYLEVIHKSQSERDALAAEVERLRVWQRDVSEGLGFDCAAGVEWPADQLVRETVTAAIDARREAESRALAAEGDAGRLTIPEALMRAAAQLRKIDTLHDSFIGSVADSIQGRAHIIEMACKENGLPLPMCGAKSIRDTARATQAGAQK